MRFSLTLALAAAIAVPLAYGIAPTVAHSFEKAKKDEMSKAERKRAEQDAIRQAVQRGEVLPLPRILAIAQAKVPGEVVKVELEYEPTGIEYEVKILTPLGRVREVEINARTGAVVKIEDD
ncbi:MAG: PepSY domain-containing protein [Sphingopyxis sp.]|nr:PepSY domain-containing protein [Sphingopyxis sp.]